eukprot:6344481-Pyramimonas_sp.AAC.1
MGLKQVAHTSDFVVSLEPCRTILGNQTDFHPRTFFHCLGTQTRPPGQDRGKTPAWKVDLAMGGCGASTQSHAELPVGALSS